MKRITSRMLAAIVVLSVGSSAVAQTSDSGSGAYPDHTVRIVVPYGAGGAADILARVLAAKLAQEWTKGVIVENKPGGVGVVGISYVVKAPPDGYTLVSVPVSDLAVNPHLYRKRPFDVVKDLDPVSQVGATPNVLVVSNGLGVSTGRDLVALAKSKAGGLTFSSPGVGSQAYLAAEMFAEQIGVRMLHVPYNSVAAALSDVAGERVDLMFAQLPTALPFIKDGRVRALGMASEKRSTLMPDMPTLAEVTGVSIGDAVSWSGLMAPAGTPLALREAIAKSVTAAMRSPDVQEKLGALGTVGLGGTPQELAAAIARDNERYGKVIRKLNIHLD